MATIIKNEKLFCTCCGGEFTLNYPISLDDYSRKVNQFTELHKDCKQTYIEPVADQSKGIKEKALWWIANGNVGMSSKTIWNCLIGNTDYRISHPYDPDDFSRCYQLLEAIPEWRGELDKLKPLSRAWNNLVENWDNLTKMFEENQQTDWKNKEKIGMYEFMQELIN
jgi:hypothetical protein